MHTIPRADETRELVLLVGIGPKNDPANLVEDHLDELEQLALTAGGTVAGRIVQRRDRPDPATFVGKGKADQMISQAAELGCTLIVFDDDLGPSQQKNLQKMAGDDLKIIDRSGLILDIFVRHARTRESKTQVELARLQYLLPRLTRQWTHLERQMGGIGARGGPGETQVEVDRRLTRNRIAKLEIELKRITAERATQRHSRQSEYRVVLVGYTNAGKSTLMNALTDADSLVQDQLFATLETTTRKMKIEGSKPILLSDTVGFIRKLPHHLVASFRATLAEVSEANLLLKVLDSSSAAVEDHDQTISEVLKDLGAERIPTVTVLNKIDLVGGQNDIVLLKRKFPEALLVSAQSRLRIEKIESAIAATRSSEYMQARFRIGSSQTVLISEVYNKLEVLDRRFEGNDTVLEVSGPSDLVEGLHKRVAASTRGGS